MSDMVDRCIEAAFQADWRFGAQFHPEDQRKIVMAMIEAMREDGTPLAKGVLEITKDGETRHVNIVNGRIQV